MVYLNSDSSFNTFYLYDIYRYHRGEYLDVRPLSSFNGHVWARQVSERELELKTDKAGWLDNMFARILRITPTFEVGDIYQTALFNARVEEVTASGEDVLEVMFEFTQPLDHPSLLLLYYDGEKYGRWQPSAQWQLLNPTLDPFGF